MELELSLLTGILILLGFFIVDFFRDEEDPEGAFIVKMTLLLIGITVAMIHKSGPVGTAVILAVIVKIILTSIARKFRWM